MFPLVVAYARTVHKVQGDTIHDPVVVDFTNMARPGQAYVALSRVVSIDQLHILPRGIQLTADMFTAHVPNDTAIQLDPELEDVIEEMDQVAFDGPFLDQ
jgi:ATP-dependent exoDNAse (exonuclease V) alpha subunit